MFAEWLAEAHPHVHGRMRPPPQHLNSKGASKAVNPTPACRQRGSLTLGVPASCASAAAAASASSSSSSNSSYTTQAHAHR
jgi:hypothetical protein